TPKDDAQAALFKHILDDANGRAGAADARLLVLAARERFAALSTDQRRALVLSDGGHKVLRDAGITWEALSGFVGKLTAAEWEALIPSMGYTALRMNLRNLAEAGISNAAVDMVNARLRDADEVARAGALPVQFLAAYRNAPLQFHAALERGIQHAVTNVPALPGRTLVLVDCSGSMYDQLSAKSSLTRMDAAAVFGSALALRAEDATLVAFGTDSGEVRFRNTDAVLQLTGRFAGMGGTRTAKAVRQHYAGHDRVVVITDEQAGVDFYGDGDVFGAVPAKVHTFTWNLAGYERGHAADTGFRHTFGGLSDAGFSLVGFIERGTRADFPF
ncbi:TROVE domain-containing protein, partial [Microbacterium sp. 13-71-7]|uniref:TROVE domain-containing protein n=1 Tax=Microbacterium sp. 13-71-7 TaxID=1970399 RepID=UPI000BD82D0F